MQPGPAPGHGSGQGLRDCTWAARSHSNVAPEGHSEQTSGDQTLSSEQRGSDTQA